MWWALTHGNYILILSGHSMYFLFLIGGLKKNIVIIILYLTYSFGFSPHSYSSCPLPLVHFLFSSIILNHLLVILRGHQFSTAECFTPWSGNSLLHHGILTISLYLQLYFLFMFRPVHWQIHFFNVFAKMYHANFLISMMRTRHYNHPPSRVEILSYNSSK